MSAVRLMRGQVVVRELTEKHALWTPAPGPRSVSTHRGVVLAMGAPARTPRVYSATEGLWKGGYDVPWGFGVGAVVQYHFAHHQQAWTMPWPADGLDATWLAQVNVDAVIE